MCAYGRRTAASAARGAAAAVLLLPRLHGGQRGSATAVSAARGPAATALMRHQLCGGQWRLCRGQRWQPNCGSSGAVASSRRSAAAVAVREGLSAIAAARWDSATSTTIAEAVRASAGAGRLLQGLRGDISAASMTAAAAVRASAVAGPISVNCNNRRLKVFRSKYAKACSLYIVLKGISAACVYGNG